MDFTQIQYSFLIAEINCYKSIYNKLNFLVELIIAIKPSSPLHAEGAGKVDCHLCWSDFR